MVNKGYRFLHLYILEFFSNLRSKGQRGVLFLVLSIRMPKSSFSGKNMIQFSEAGLHPRWKQALMWSLPRIQLCFWAELETHNTLWTTPKTRPLSAPIPKCERKMSNFFGTFFIKRT
ncbi:MAG: hypothetical protein C0407_09510 [Desulfobacca sp.]|nr:hypothetical protein [Desulfobacca sp.]